MSQSAALATSGDVMSSFSTVSSGASLRRAADWSSVSVVAMTRWPRAANATLAPLPNPEPAPVINTVFVTMRPPVEDRLPPSVLPEWAMNVPWGH
jgi:hypothetical protein